MARYVVIRDSDGLVTNAVEWDGDTAKWQPPAGHSARLTNAGNPGDTWNGTIFIAPAPVVPEQSKLDALIDLLATKSFVMDVASLMSRPVVSSSEKSDLESRS